MTQYKASDGLAIIDPRFTPAQVAPLSGDQPAKLAYNAANERGSPFLAGVDGKPLSAQAHRWLGPSYTYISQLFEETGKPWRGSARQLAVLTQRVLALLRLDKGKSVFEKESLIAALTGKGGTPNRRLFERPGNQNLVTIQLARPHRFAHWTTEPIGAGTPCRIRHSEMPSKNRLAWAASLGIPVLLKGTSPKSLPGDAGKILVADQPCWRTLSEWEEIAEITSSIPVIDELNVFGNMKSAATVHCSSQYAAISPGWALALEAAFTAQLNNPDINPWLSGAHDLLLAKIALLAERHKMGRIIGVDTGRLYLSMDHVPSKDSLNNLVYALSPIGAYILYQGTVYAQHGETRNALTAAAARMITEKRHDLMSSADKFLIDSKSTIEV